MLRYLAVVALLAGSSLAQTNSTCTLPPTQVRAAKDNFFTEEQENQLGDVVAEQWQQRLTIIHDDALAQHLRDVGGKVVAQLPTSMTYHFELIELPEANAFSLPGGRIYVSRKVIALAQSDDELAGLLAHELGHEVTHQAAAMISRVWRQLFGISQVTSADEIRKRYNQMLDLQARTHVKVDSEEDDQLSADSVALEAMTRAGYNPAAFASLFNRLTDTRNGKSGFFSDLFGTTPPDVTRFRKLQKVIASFPAACTSQRAPTGTFLQWQGQVIGYDSTAVARAPMPGLVWQRKLNPALRPDLTHIRFSSDGKHLLVQDSGGIEILTREPLAPMFRISAGGARPAEFSADSQTVSFYVGTTDPRVEVWSVAQKQRLAVHELHMKRECAQSELSSDGRFFACVASTETNMGLEFNLVLYDVNTSAEFLRAQNILDVVGLTAFLVELQMQIGSDDNDEPIPLLYLHFSPDAHFLVAAREQKTIVYDLTRHTTVALPGEFKGKLQHEFVFLAPNRVIVRKERESNLAEVRSFPEGYVVSDGIRVGGGILISATDPNFVLLRFKSSEEHPLVLLDLKQNKPAVAFRGAAGDGLGAEIASERRDGEIAVEELPKCETKAKIDLPGSPLGRVQVVTASDDLSWLALSDRNRGGVWSLHTGDRLYHLRGFTGAYFGGLALYADMPKHDKAPRSIAHMNLAITDINATELTGEDSFEQHGSVLLVMKADRKGNFSAMKFGPSWNTIEARDVVSQKVLWSKTFTRHIDHYYAHDAADSIVFATREKDDVALEFHRLSTGNDLGNLTVHTNKESFAVTDARAAGDYFLVDDSEHRVTLYNKAGQETAHVFGTGPIAAPETGVLAVSSEEQQVSLYDLASGQKLRTVQLPQRQIYYRFDSTGKQLLVLTADQTAYAFDVQEMKAVQSAKAN